MTAQELKREIELGEVSEFEHRQLLMINRQNINVFERKKFLFF